MRGSIGEEHPSDPVVRSVMVAKISTGEIDEDKLPPARRNRGLKGGVARAKALSPGRRTEMSQMGGRPSGRGAQLPACVSPVVSTSPNRTSEWVLLCIGEV